ncbi:hypothetical protein [Janibacter sp. GS2]|uniref:hypothetical protein n=1 Tax=Janibacter sp. GS2 TaxID=3442646 RepID=UPI003EBB2A10
MRRSIPTLAVISVLALGACSADGATDSGSSTSSSSSSSSEAAAAKNDGNATAEREGVVYFGQTYDWPSVGLSVKIERDGFYNGEQQYGPRFKFTMKNTGDKPYDIGTPGINTQVDDADAEEIWDDTKGMEGNPGTVVLPGKSTTYTSVWEGSKASAVIISVQPDMETEAAYFTDKGAV